MKYKIILVIQLVGTLTILAWVPTNLGKTVAFLILWLLTFRSFVRAEIILYFIVCLFFTIMDVQSLQQGIFAFTHPDFLGMPLYEPFMWGFYLLHTLRMLGGPPPVGKRLVAWLLFILFTAAFGIISNQSLLLVATALLLFLGIVIFHEKEDLAYVGYMILLGAAIEYTGVLSGQWSYPNNPPGGVPLWFITLWGGMGFFLRRLILSILASRGYSTDSRALVALG